MQDLQSGSGSITMADALITSTAYAVNPILANDPRAPDQYLQLPQQQPSPTATTDPSGGNVVRTNIKSTAAANPAATSAVLTNDAAANSRISNLPDASSARQGLKTEYTYFAPTSPNEISVKQSDVATANPTLTERTSGLVYDRLDRLTKAVSPPPELGLTPSATDQLENGGFVTRFGYDNLSNPISETDGLNNTTTYAYDDLNRLTKVARPNPVAGATLDTSIAYSATSTGWKLTQTDPAGAVTTLARDSFDNLLSLTDPLNNLTAYGYNKLNQLVTETKTVSGSPLSRSNSYDGVGNLRSMIDRNGRTIEYEYDKLYRPATETWKTGAVTNRTLSYAYDTADRLLTVDDSDPLATDFQFAYVARNQLQSERQFTGLVNRSVVLDRDFDVDGNRTKLATTFGATLSGTTIVGGQKDFVSSFAYDNMNRLTSVIQTSVTGGNAVSPKTAAFQYNAASQLTDLRRYSATSANPANLKVHTRNSYDAAGRLKSITNGKTEIAAGENWNGTATLPASLGATNMLAGYYLSYDQGNRVTSLASQFDRFSTTYSYNSTDQLTGSTSLGIAGMAVPSFVPPTESYNWDANGNRRTSGGGSQSAPGTHNRLQTDGTYNYTYDNEGNTTRRTLISSGLITDYTWDHRNRLATVTERTSGGVATKKVEYIYDAFDQRVAKRLDANGDGAYEVHEAWVWADGQEVLRLLDSDGPTTVQPFRVKNRYLYGDAVDMLLADEQCLGSTVIGISRV